MPSAGPIGHPRGRRIYCGSGRCQELGTCGLEPDAPPSWRRAAVPIHALMESASRALRSKFEAARAVLERMRAGEISPDQVATLSASLAALELRFALETSHLYLQAGRGESYKTAAVTEFSRILASRDFARETNKIVENVESLLISLGAPLREASGDSRKTKPKKNTRCVVSKFSPQLAAELQRLLDRYPRDGCSIPSGSIRHVDYTTCPECGTGMAIDADRSELRCTDPLCGVLRALVGIVFDDAQFYIQEGQKAKSGTFNPNRHFHAWWLHILAREPEEEIGDADDPDNQYGEKLISTLREIVRRDGHILRCLTVVEIREMLREIRRTDLNKNVPLILKKLTGIGPPQITEAVAVRAENLFTKAIEASNMLDTQMTGDAHTTRVNRNYYPYYISRILDAILPADDYESRRVFYYIYVQGDDTVDADDDNWELICRDLGEEEIKYKPADRALGQLYGPMARRRRP